MLKITKGSEFHCVGCGWVAGKLKTDIFYGSEVQRSSFEWLHFDDGDICQCIKCGEHMNPYDYLWYKENPAVCDCGAEKCKTTHAFWCSKYAETA